MMYHKRYTPEDLEAVRQRSIQRQEPHNGGLSIADFFQMLQGLGQDELIIAPILSVQLEQS